MIKNYIPPVLTEEALIEELVTASHVLHDQGVLDAFGHISVRDPDDSNYFFMARKMATNAIRIEDIQKLDLEGNAVDGRPSYLERFIHTEIYKARPDVQSVLHSHAVSVLPYTFTDRPLRAVTHMGAFLGNGAPVFEIRETHGNSTDLFGGSASVGAEIANKLADEAVVLMCRHGLAVVGNSIRETVFRAVYAENNAQIQAAGEAIGNINYLTPGEIQAAGALVGQQADRGWESWTLELKKRGWTLE